MDSEDKMMAKTRTTIKNVGKEFSRKKSSLLPKLFCKNMNILQLFTINTTY
jgi:hypothetical protein